MKFDVSTTVLDLLKSGGSVKFLSGYELEGDPDTGYIQLLLPPNEGVTRRDREDGLCDLTEKGLNEAYTFALQFETGQSGD